MKAYVNEFEQMMAKAATFGIPKEMPKIDFRPEPWMKKFVEEKHTQEEWDGFFDYCDAGPFKRMVIQMIALLRFGALR